MGEKLAVLVYLLCGFASILCAVALFRGHRLSKNRLLFWSGLCFGFLALNCIFLCFDLLVFPLLDLHGPLIRSALTALAGLTLLSGLIWEIA